MPHDAETVAKESMLLYVPGVPEQSAATSYSYTVPLRSPAIVMEFIDEVVAVHGEVPEGL